MELLKTAKRKSFYSELLYIVLNVAMAVAILITVIVTASPFYALLLVLLSKWRVFAVRARYWTANIRANLVDTIVGVSIVIFLYAATGSIETQIALTVLYILWLLFIKPRSKRSYIVLQAGIGLFLGIGAIMQMSAGLPSSVVVIVSWLVGYSTARHVLSVEHETHLNFLSLLWAFVVAEIAWLSYHWTIAYNLPGSIQLSQSAVIITMLSFLAERVHASFQRDGKVQLQEVILPTLLTVSVIGVLLFLFGSAATI